MKIKIKIANEIYQNNSLKKILILKINNFDSYSTNSIKQCLYNSSDKN